MLFRKVSNNHPPQNSLIEKGDQENPPKIEGTEKVFTQVPYHGSWVNATTPWKRKIYQTYQ